MIKNEILSIRISDKYRKKIESIREQMIRLHGFDKEELTDSFIIRHAISTLDEKVKYFIYEDKYDFYKNKRDK